MIRDLIAKYRQLHDEMKSAMAPALKEAAQTIFDADAKVQTVQWTQYAPYFNDGDACIFSVHEPTLSFDEAATGDEESDYDGEEEVYEYDIPEGVLKEAFQAFAEIIQADELSDAMENIYGDGVLVTIHRDGNIETREYSHE